MLMIFLSSTGSFKLHIAVVCSQNFNNLYQLMTFKNFVSIFFRRKLHIRGLTFDELLHSIVGFNNQGNVSFLLDTLKLDETSSYMRGLHKYVVISAFICETISITPILYMGAKYDGGLLYHYEKDYDYFLKIMAFFFFFALRHWICE